MEVYSSTHFVYSNAILHTLQKIKFAIAHLEGSVSVYTTNALLYAHSVMHWIPLAIFKPSEHGDHNIYIVTLNFLSLQRQYLYVYAHDKFVRFPRKAKKLNKF